MLKHDTIVHEIHEIVEESLVKGHVLILNFDDCRIKYEELFDPDIKEFYGKMMLSQFMWTPEMFSQQNCWKSHMDLMGNHEIEHPLNKNFKFVVYSKFVIEPDLQEHDLINMIEKRFEKCFSLLNVNVLILSNFNAGNGGNAGGSE